MINSFNSGLFSLQQNLDLSYEANNQDPSAGQKRTRDASHPPEGESEKTRVSKSFRNLSGQEDVHQNVSKMLLPDDILPYLFSLILNRWATCITTLSIVCKQWKRVVEDVLVRDGGSFLMHIPMLLNPTMNSGQPSVRAIGESCSNKVSMRSEVYIQKTKQEFDFQRYPRITFHEDSHVIGCGENEICIGDLSGVNPPRKIKCNGGMRSYCAVQDMIYIGDYEGNVSAFSMSWQNRKPIYTLKVCDPEYLDHFKLFLSFQILANDKWLITIVAGVIKQWDRLTGAFIKKKEIQSEVIPWGISMDKLFWRPTDGALQCWDLNTDVLSTIKLEGTIYNVHMFGDKCFFMKHDTDRGMNICVLDLVTEELALFLTTIPSNHVPPKLIAYSDDQVFLVGDSFNPKREIENIAAGKPAIAQVFDPLPVKLEFIDLPSGRSIKIREDRIHRYSLQWSIATFKNKILFANRNNQVVTITFFPGLDY